ncbi:MAG: hypothetical protein A3F74_08375 [Betaproteobacteria bacterium RIFCSPLOWO2_12_FULL_62_58]|nr:MAG: hypothetical protein A3F74_08375 [Betaproteobacteria bacterium RIFCSPLOWO2_12_FULL_62_58]
MLKLKHCFLFVCAGVVFGILQQSGALAQDAFPSKPVRFIAPFSAGGPTDLLARVIGQKLNELWGQPVVVENRPGAGGNIGAEVVAKAVPDGHTLLVSASSVAINPSIYSKMPFDTAKDLAPIGLAGVVPNVLVVHPSVPVTNVRELISFAHKNPRALQYGSGGSGTGSHLIGELFQHMTETQLVHIPYKGGSQYAMALLTGEVAVAFSNMVSALPHVRTGKIKALGVTSSSRSEFLPKVPTIAESGVPGFEADSWYGVFTTGRTPQETVRTLNEALLKTLDMQDVRERLHSLGVIPKKMTSQEFAAFVASEMKKWGDVVRISKAKVE